MKPTQDFLDTAEKRIRLTLQELRPQLLKTQGVIEHRLKDDKTAVTEMDLAVENRLQAALKEVDPAIGFCGEETGVDYDQQTFWLVDPIDGTEPFIRGLPFATNVIALIDNQRPVMSVIYNFFLDEYFLAIRGQGATMNGHPVRVSNRPFDRAYVVPANGFTQVGLNDMHVRLLAKVQGLPQTHASGFQFSSLARGAIEANIFWGSGGNAWDRAAGALLVQEAGGRVENIGTPGYDYRNTDVLAANPVVFDELMQLILEVIATKQ